MIQEVLSPHRGQKDANGQKEEKQSHADVFYRLVREKLNHQSAVSLEHSRLPGDDANNLTSYHQKLAVLGGENGLKITVLAEWSQYNPFILPGNFIKVLIESEGSNSVIELELRNNDEPLSVKKGGWDERNTFIQEETIIDPEEIDYLLTKLREARINPILTRRTAQARIKNNWETHKVTSQPVGDILSCRTGQLRQS